VRLGKYQDSFYLGTHIVYAISAYSGIKVSLCLCVREREREYVCVCGWVGVRESERE
jgi:hypothetical protein